MYWRSAGAYPPRTYDRTGRQHQDIDDLYLTWNSHISGSALYRRALRDEMELRDVDPNKLRNLFERARKQDYAKDEIAEKTNRYADLKTLVNDAEE